MNFVRAIWKLLVGVKDALVLLLLMLFFAGLYGVLTAQRSQLRMTTGMESMRVPSMSKRTAAKVRPPSGPR